ncbi:hypothetical protein Agub_g12338, partial [Astrephomene gubernaculifera]
MRRQTLANVTPLHVNKVLDKSGAAGPSGTCAKNGSVLRPGRQSLAVGSMAAATSFSVQKRVSTKPGGAKGNRPLASKEFETTCISNISGYLSDHHFSINGIVVPSKTSSKTLAQILSSPTGKDFNAIATFLLRQFGSSDMFQGKVEDEVPLFFKRLGYPITLSKSAVYPVVVPHTWPAVLAALSWLVDLLRYQEQACTPSSNALADEKHAQGVAYLGDCYAAYMAHDDEEVSRLDQKHQAKLLAQQERLDASCEKLRQANAELLAELERLRALPDPVEEAQQRRAEQVADNEKFESLIQQLQAQKESYIQKVSGRKADVKARLAQVAAAESELEQLQQQVASQTVTKADVNRMVIDMSKHWDVFQSEEERCEEMQLKVQEQETQIVRGLTALESTVERYNKLAHRLKLVPATSKRADGKNYELRINRDASTQAEFSNLDLKGVIKPGLESLHDNYRTRASQLSQDLASLREQCVVRQEANAEKEEENAALEAEIAKLERQLQTAKDMRDDACKQLAEQAHAIKTEIAELSSAASNREEEVEQRVQVAKAQYEQATRDAEAEINRVMGDMKRA